jgi:hypothetical protein
LPYGLEVWHDGVKMLRVVWAEDGALAVSHFIRGAWEDDTLVL